MVLLWLLACSSTVPSDPGTPPPDGIFEGLVWQADGFASRRVVSERE